MFSAHSKIGGLQFFDCDYIGSCWKCKQVFYSGLRVNLRYKYDAAESLKSILLCKKHAIQAIQCNVIDLPLNVTEFLFRQKDAEARQSYLKQLRNLEELTPALLLDRLHSGEIEYWYESVWDEVDCCVTRATNVKTIEFLAEKRQAVVYQEAERFQIRYFYQDYVELGEWDWRSEKTRQITCAADLRHAISITLLELTHQLNH